MFFFQTMTTDLARRLDNSCITPELTALGQISFNGEQMIPCEVVVQIGNDEHGVPYP